MEERPKRAMIFINPRTAWAGKTAYVKVQVDCYLKEGWDITIEFVGKCPWRNDGKRLDI